MTFGAESFPSTRPTAVVSEHGRPLPLVNPWPSSTVLRLWRNGQDAATLAGPELSIPTSPGEVLHVAPMDTSYESILSEMSVPL